MEEEGAAKKIKPLTFAGLTALASAHFAARVLNGHFDLSCLQIRIAQVLRRKSPLRIYDANGYKTVLHPHIVRLESPSSCDDFTDSGNWRSLCCPSSSLPSS